MKALFITSALTAALLTSCSGSNKKADDSSSVVSEAPVEHNVDLKGRWTIECIVFNDSLTVTPSSEVPGVAQYAVFEDGSFSFNTNCNSIQGEYQLKGDSILIPVSLSTEMACDNMATEDAIRKILPGISTVSMENDSTVRLVASSPAGYILLRRADDNK